MCPWNGKSYSASTIVAAPASAPSGVPLHLRQGHGAPALGSRERHWGLGAEVREQLLGGRERCLRRLLPLHLEQTRRLDGLFLTLADDHDVVAPAHDLDESRDVPDRRLVDADQRCARQRRPDVAGMDHPGKADVHGPLE